MTSDLDALLAAVLAAPADDTVRLIYADALDEAGQHDRAEFIRVQCELASLDAAIVCHQPGAKLGDACNDLLCPRCGREHELYRRSEQLLARHANDWFPFGPDEPAPVSAGSPLLTVRHGGGHMRVEYRRGFVAGLECGSEFWVAHGDAIRARHPVERVELSTMVPGVAVDFADRPVPAFHFRLSAAGRLASQVVFADLIPPSPTVNWLNNWQVTAACRLCEGVWPGVRFVCGAIPPVTDPSPQVGYRPDDPTFLRVMRLFYDNIR